MKINKFCLALFALASVSLVGCENEDVNEQHFGNKLYITSAVLVDDLLIDVNNPDDVSRTITPRLAKAATQDITVTFAPQPSLAAQYNMIYGDNAQALPAEYYEIPQTSALIPVGTVSGTSVDVNFSGVYQLDKDMRYVLPVTITDASGMSVLASSRTIYFVFKGAALINVVANISKMYFPVNWASGVNVSGIKTVTIETLLRSQSWEAGRDNALSTLIGIEGGFLIRIGDADRPRNQLQLVSPGGSWPSPNVAPGLPVNEWIHIAIVYDVTTKERIYYQNGKVVASDMGATGSVSLKSGCNIGKSWDNSRWLPGEISEMRIWNIQRTAKEIAENPYYVDPKTPGLIAYWKFNEGAGGRITDATLNGTNLTAAASVSGATVIWVPVELPPIGK